MRSKTDVDLAMKLAMAYWKKNGFNLLIKSQIYNSLECEKLSTKINGGKNGLEQRKENTKKAFEILNAKE